MAGRKKVEIDLKEVERLAECCQTEQQIMDCLGVKKTYFYKRKAEGKEFADVIKRGRARRMARISGAVLAAAEDGNITAQIFALKCQGGWKEAQEVQHKGTIDVKVEIINSRRNTNDNG